ncbi:hypothetical protein F3Y22_tig00110894pilonHSYRG00004 [Hibiscus syriacus]|uniref:O-fucosyltransferase family protein n=1 Tax=Hibiscus syriacus TaxID=106335 RepID=A0A6A2ZHF9_HIBSY|nr:hypothetical protein F3Y22_tig00110894pilonHSYRG00004 [Hibiscus syriacus]
MALLRRRNLSHRNRIQSLVNMLSVISGVLLILFALLSFLAPSPNESQHLHLHLRHHQSSFNAVVEDLGTSEDSVFHVPNQSCRGKLDLDIWSSRNAEFFYGCSNASAKFAKAEAVSHPTRYLAIATSGGLNQQRTGITDAVVASRILNATLVVPKLDQKSFWKDASNFSEIFDVDWFISSLSKDVKIIKQLPKRRGKSWTPYTMRVPRKCSHAVQLNKFDYRLANKLDSDLQKLRCRVNYHALKFADPVLEMGKTLVHRMRMRSKRYCFALEACIFIWPCISVMLISCIHKFEPDMLAFSGCDYGGGEKERNELGAIRKRWKTLHKNNPDRQRRQGKCPLTPEEVGLMLRALGYGSDVHIYVASGAVYGGEETLRPLKSLFPNFYSKDTIATKEELAPFSSFSSRMAALDFIVCDESDVKYFGHKPTIRPNAKKLYQLFLNRNNMTWEAFASSVRTFQRGFMGEPKEVRPGRGEFHENPTACICEDSEAREKANVADLRDNKNGKSDASSKKEAMVSDDQNDYGDNDEPKSPDLDDDDDQIWPQEKLLYNETGLDYVVISDEPELEEIFSD